VSAAIRRAISSQSAVLASVFAMYFPTRQNKSLKRQDAASGCSATFNFVTV